MENVKTVFVVLTYRNEKDLEDFLVSAQKHVNSYAVVVVNSFYDDDSMNKIKNVAEKYNCKFLNVENRGYGYGNNRGIEYANDYYIYEYLVVANPDTEIKSYPESAFTNMENAVIAPNIINKLGKKQNPMVWIKNNMADFFVYKGLKGNIKPLFYMGLGLNKLLRQLFFIIYKNKKGNVRIYQAHGSFIIFSQHVMKKIGLPFDENVFLFAEEGDLATILRKNKLNIYYSPKIEIFHKEDGSMQFRDDLDSRLIDANIYIYEKYHKRSQ